MVTMIGLPIINLNHGKNRKLKDIIEICFLLVSDALS